MGSPERPSSPEAKVASAPPEELARVVLRCRALAAFLAEASGKLPPREEAPFLHGQLESALQELNQELRKLAPEEQAPEKGGFLRLLTGRRPRESARKSEPRFDLEGTAWSIPVTELVDFLSRTGKSGLLWVTSTTETFVLEFNRGNLVHATSNAPPASCRLGEILLSERLLEPQELADVIEHARAADDLLGSYLLRSGRLRHGDLQRVLAIQVQQLFHRLMDAENATYRFQEGAQLLKSHGLEVNTTHLLLESARKKDEEHQRVEGTRQQEAAGLALLDELAEPVPPGALPAAPEPVIEEPEPDDVSSRVPGNAG